MFLHIIQAEYLGDYRLKLFFNNGAIGEVDLEAELYGEVFEPLLDSDLFQQFSITSRTIEWLNGADFAPEFLYDIANLIQEPHKPLVTNHYSLTTTH